jgi:hypothetical protein
MVMAVGRNGEYSLGVLVPTFTPLRTGNGTSMPAGKKDVCINRAGCGQSTDQNESVYYGQEEKPLKYTTTRALRAVLNCKINRQQRRQVEQYRGITSVKEKVKGKHKIQSSTQHTRSTLSALKLPPAYYTASRRDRSSSES